MNAPLILTGLEPLVEVCERVSQEILDDRRAERDSEIDYEVENYSARSVFLSCGCVWGCTHYEYGRPVNGRLTKECAYHGGEE